MRGAGVGQEYKEFTGLLTDKLPAGWESALPTYTPEDKPLATRLHSQTNLNALASVLPGPLPCSSLLVGIKRTSPLVGVQGRSIFSPPSSLVCFPALKVDLC